MTQTNTFIVLTTDRFNPRVSKGAVGFCEEAPAEGSPLLTVRFSDDRVFRMPEYEFRPATPAEIAVLDNDPDLDEFMGADENDLDALRAIFHRPDFHWSDLSVRAYYCAARIRSRGSLDTGPEAVRAMCDRIRRDHSEA